MSNNLEAPGALSVIDLSVNERNNFIDYLYNKRPDLNPDIFYEVFGDNLLKVYDVFAGQTIKFPPREYIEKHLTYVKVYTFCQVRGFTDDSYELAAKVFKRRKASVVRIVESVKEILTKERSNSNE